MRSAGPYCCVSAQLTNKSRGGSEGGEPEVGDHDDKACAEKGRLPLISQQVLESVEHYDCFT